MKQSQKGLSKFPSAALPAKSLMLGIGRDGLPLVLDLTESGVGSFLVVSDSEVHNQRILSVVLSSAYHNLDRYQAVIHIITAGIGEQDLFSRQPLVRSTLSHRDPESPALITELHTLMEHREEGRLRLPAQLLVIEDFFKFAEILSPNAYHNLLTLVTQGPFWGIWVIASMIASQLQERFYEAVERFPSRIMGKIDEISLARYFAGLPLINLHSVGPDQAVVRAGEDVFSVWLPPD